MPEQTSEGSQRAYVQTANQLTGFEPPGAHWSVFLFIWVLHAGRRLCQPDALREASAEKFLELMVRHPSLDMRMIQTIANQYLRHEEQFDQLAFQEDSVRLAQVLLHLAEDGG